MVEVGDGLGTRSARITLRHRREAKARYLREDEPHPVAFLDASCKLGDHARIDRFLGFDEAVQIMRLCVHFSSKSLHQRDLFVLDESLAEKTVCFRLPSVGLNLSGLGLDYAALLSILCHDGANLPVGSVALLE